jgi:hypothetical protein
MDQESICWGVLPRQLRPLYRKQTSNITIRSRVLDSTVRQAQRRRMGTMKKFLTIIWDFFVEWGNYRYKMAKKHGYMMY